MNRLVHMNRLIHAGPKGRVSVQLVRTLLEVPPVPANQSEIADGNWGAAGRVWHFDDIVTFVVGDVGSDFDS